MVWWPFGGAQKEEEGKKKPDNKDKGGKFKDEPLYLPIQGQTIMTFVEMSNRVNTLCRDYESRLNETKRKKEAEERNKEMMDMLKKMGLVPQGRLPAITPQKKQRTGNEDDGDDGDDNASPMPTTMNLKDVFLSVSAAEKLAREMGVTVVIGVNKTAAINATEAATHITNSADFDDKKWRAARNKLFGYNANAGRGVDDEAIVAGYLSGKVAREIN